MTIHWFDLYSSETKFFDVYNFLLKGNFSFQKSHWEFSRLGLDQIHEQNNKLIKGCGGASDLLNKVDDSALIYCETCSPEIARVILEFEDYLDQNEILVESSTKLSESRQPFYERFSSDVSRLIKCITVNSFMQNHLTKLNNKKIVVPQSVRTVIDDLKAMGEKQLKTFIYDQLVVSKVPISRKITFNKIEIWNHTHAGQLKCKVEFSPSKFALKKMNSTCEIRKTMTMAEHLFEHEIKNIPQSLCKDGIELFHGSKVEISKRFNSPTSMMLPHDQEDKSAIAVEMSPLIRAKAFATHVDSLTDFGGFALLVYYKVMKLASNYHRTYLVFDQYFEGDSTEIPYKMAESFLKNNQNKNELNEHFVFEIPRTLPV